MSTDGGVATGQIGRATPVVVRSPGETIQHWLDLNGRTQTWLSAQVGLSRRQIGRIVCHGAVYNASFAVRLAAATGVTARRWMVLQAEHQLRQVSAEPDTFTAMVRAVAS